MGLDRTVHFRPAEGPTATELRAVCEDYFDAGAELSAKSGTIIAVLPGRNSYALRRHGRATKAQRGFWQEVRDGDPRERWIEVWRDGRKSVSVTTRQHDEFTDALADRLAEVIAHGWAGRIESDG
jgi:hypothetical protein